MKQNTDNRRVYVSIGICADFNRSDLSFKDETKLAKEVKTMKQMISALNRGNSVDGDLSVAWSFSGFASLPESIKTMYSSAFDMLRERVNNDHDVLLADMWSSPLGVFLNEEEFRQSCKLGINNPEKNGVLDFFGRCNPIYRPVSGVVCPEHIEYFTNSAIEALILRRPLSEKNAFYRATRSFRTESAYNPISLHDGLNRISVIPAVTLADINAEGSFASFADSVRRRLLRKNSTSDVLIHIDLTVSELADNPEKGIKRLFSSGKPRFEKLLDEILSVDFIKLTTPQGYLRDHDCIGNVKMTCALSGDEPGLMPWTEKPGDRMIWTACERSRLLLADNNSRQAALLNRMRLELFSESAYGPRMPSPVHERVDRFEKLAYYHESECVKEFRNSHTPVFASGGNIISGRMIKVLNPNLTTRVCATIELGDMGSVRNMRLASEELKDFSCVLIPGTSTVFAVMEFNTVKEEYRVLLSEQQLRVNKLDEFDYTLETERAIYTTSKKSPFCDIVLDGIPMSSSGELITGRIVYDGEMYDFAPGNARALVHAGSCRGFENELEIILPRNAENGRLRADSFVVPGFGGLFMAVEIRYPRTMVQKNSGAYDSLWSEVMPFLINPDLSGDIDIYTRTVSGKKETMKLSGMPVQNVERSVINTQTTSGIFSICDSDKGIAVAACRFINGSPAFCPVAYYGRSSVAVAPFGTFAVPEREELGNDRLLADMAERKSRLLSVAPAYNGVTERMLLYILPFTDSLSFGDMTELSIVADGGLPVII